MRLIDADDLKEKSIIISDGPIYREVIPISVIDNAPTVPNEYIRGYEAAEREYKRPQQGEWIKGPEISRTMIDDTVLYINYKDYTCSNCGLVLDRLLYHVDGSPFYKFCPECGADMRGVRE